MHLMQAFTRLGLTAGATLAVTAVLAVSASAASAATSGPSAGPNQTGRGYDGAQNVVFVQTDNTAGNQILAFHRDQDGTLTPAGTYGTGGLGGVLAGSVVDHLASQGSLTYDPRHQLLYAVNAGSDTVSVFAVDGDRLALHQTVGSGGSFPVSVAVHGDVVYVLNALDGGSIQGYRLVDGHLLVAVPAWKRPLGLDPAATPQFTNTPGQVGFSADGRQLLVTTKANTNAVDVFALERDGAPAATPVVNTLPGTVPFSFVTHGRHRILLTEAGPNAVATFVLHRDGTLTQTSSAPTGQSATCWISSTGDHVYASNAGSSNLSGFRTDPVGVLTSLGTTPTDPGTVDSAVSADGRYLYAQTGGEGVVDEFRIHRDGSLSALGSQTVPNAVGGEGIVAF
jgi:6-phosphogluconolactonase (cycloisomerase 2 family)